MNYEPRPEFDGKDRELLKIREAKRMERQSKSGEPEVGDFVYMPVKEGEEPDLRRFTHDWGDSIQTTCGPRHPCHGDTSFYIDRDGECSFSGSLDRSIPKDKIKIKENGNGGALRYGNIWFFHHDWPGAGRGVYAMISFKVWEYVP